MHATLCFNWAPVVYSGLFASLVLWFYLSKRITLGSITLCHHHHWCCCWDISLCLNPSCVIKVPLCISSPSLSENLSCPLMGVCWWVWQYGSLWVMVCNVICACSNTSAHCVVLCSTSAFLGTCHFCFSLLSLSLYAEWSKKYKLVLHSDRSNCLCRLLLGRDTFLHLRSWLTFF